MHIHRVLMAAVLLTECGGIKRRRGGTKAPARHAPRKIRDSCRITRLWFRSRGEKDVERDTIVGFDLEKFNAYRVFLHPLYRGETHFHGWLIPGKIQHERELLAALKEVIDTEPCALPGEIE
jgi:hypothetical protein